MTARDPVSSQAMLLQFLVLAVQYALVLAILPGFAAGFARLVPAFLVTLAAMLLGACCALWLAIVFVAFVARFVRRTASPWLVDTAART